MTLSIQLTERDFIESQKLHFRPKPALRWTWYVFTAILVGMLVQEMVLMVQGSPLPKGWWVLPAGLAYGVFLFYILLPWRIGRIYRQNPGLANVSEVTFDEAGMGLGSGRGEIRFPWAGLRKWKRNRDTILVYHSGSHFHTFPRHCFGAEDTFEALAGLLAKHIGPASL